ncbi:hypothetical protein ACFE04_007614 [Oxalis oulophora]
MASTYSSFLNTPAPRIRPSPKCGKLDGVAMWVVNGMAAAFFASLEKCSCIRIATYESDSEESIDLPLIFNDGNTRRRDNGTTTSKRRSGKAKVNGGSSTYVEEY